jgi:hypothetical protein
MNNPVLEGRLVALWEVVIEQIELPLKLQYDLFQYFIPRLSVQAAREGIEHALYSIAMFQDAIPFSLIVRRQRPSES